MAHFVISANRTADGGVVYMTADRRWTTRLAEALAHPSKVDTASGLSWARTREAVVCDPHPIKVKLGEAGPIAADAKQRIRAAGPEATMASLGFLGAAADAAHIHRAELPANDHDLPTPEAAAAARV